MMFLKLAIFALIAVLRWLGSINNVDLINLININVNINSAVPTSSTGKHFQERYNVSPDELNGETFQER